MHDNCLPRWNCVGVDLCNQGVGIMLWNSRFHLLPVFETYTFHFWQLWCTWRTSWVHLCSITGSVVGDLWNHKTACCSDFVLQNQVARGTACTVGGLLQVTREAEQWMEFPPPPMARKTPLPTLHCFARDVKRNLKWLACHPGQSCNDANSSATFGGDKQMNWACSNYQPYFITTLQPFDIVWTWAFVLQIFFSKPSC